MSFSVEQIDLSMTSPDTGEYLTANVYTVPGVTEADGKTPRLLSIGQLVMAICLQRAYLLENGVLGVDGKRTDGIIPIMDEMNTTSAKLEKMTDIEKTVLDYGCYMSDITKNGIVWEGTNYTCRDFLMYIVEMDPSSIPTGQVTASDTDFLTALESKMDELNTFSQEKMIELQSYTNKRDQAYDMISNVLKSLNTTIIGNINNM
jgi:hypothetical protein